MRIGVVTTSYPRHDGDAAGSFVAAHVAALRAAGHEVEIVSALSLGGGGSLFERGGAPDVLEHARLRTYLDAAGFTVRMSAEVTRRARTWDLVVAHWLVPSALAALPSTLGVSTRLPILAIAHGGDVHTLRRLHLLAPALHALRARRAKLVFVSEALRATARTTAPRLSAYLDDALVQPMGIDVARFSAIRARRDPRDIVVVARMVPIKGVDVALDAYARARTSAPLVIAGDGPERARLEARSDRRSHVAAARSLRVDASNPKRVAFLGAVDAAARDRVLERAALVLIPSRVLANGRSEGAPMIALEALACGVPVIASAVGGLADLRGVPGMTLVPPDDPAALAAAIERALELPTPSDADMSPYDWQRVSARLLAHAGFADAEGICRRSPSLCEVGDTITRRGA